MAIRFTCGACGTSSIGRVTGNHEKYISSTDTTQYCLVKCDHCRSGTYIKFNLNTGYVKEFGTYYKDNIVIDFDQLHDKAIFPSRDLECPILLPSRIENAYLDAEFNFQASRWKAAAQLYLQSIEFACVFLETSLNGDEKSTSLQKETLTRRINSLFEQGKLTVSLKEWGHQIRVIGQAHKHEYSECSEGECAELRSFCEMFLNYSISVPAMIEGRRERLRQSQTDEH